MSGFVRGRSQWGPVDGQGEGGGRGDASIGRFRGTGRPTAEQGDDPEATYGRRPVPAGQRPEGALRHRGRCGPSGRRGVVQCRTGTDPGHRRRVGLGQERDQPGDPRPAQRPAYDHHRADPGRRAGTRRNARARDPQTAWPGPVDDLPGSALRAAPLLHGGPADRRGVPDPPPGGEQAGGPAAGHRHARPGRHPAAGQAGRPVPARVLRRHAAAGDDRDVPGQRPGPGHRRRADHRPGRHRAGADPRPAGGPSSGVQLRDHHDHPRPRCGQPGRRRGTGDVRRTGRRARQRRAGAPPAAAPVHLGVALQCAVVAR